MTDSNPPLAATALALSVQDWQELGFGADPAVAPTSDLDILTERVTALLLVRLVAIQTPPGTFQDLSTSTICRTVLMKQMAWPKTITDQVIEQLREFCHRMLKGYKDVPYHNMEHAFHVVLSVNKLTDLMLNHHGGETTRPPSTFGLRSDPLALCAMLFAALVHDVEHQGIPNRQLAIENDRLAVLYNDQSIAENWSLYVAFSDLLQDEFQHLRHVMFVEPNEDYLRFRRIVINLVLNTDIASPERTQIGKSKWKEAFGDPFETVERKIRAEVRRMSLTGMQIKPGRANRRATGASALSELSHPNDGDGDDNDDSWSATPENSAHDDEQEENDGVSPTQAAFMSPAQPTLTRYMSSGDSSAKLERRMSNASKMTANSKYRYRLGILRSVDLSGETLETYSRRGSMTSNYSHSGQSHSGQSTSETDHVSVYLAQDEPDELKATVVMETIMTAADVAHNLQGWKHMVKWSSRLYMELRRAYQSKRGFDPQERWFENQIGFLESYLLPLARRLEDTGVFGETVGPVFAQIVEENRDHWLTEGYDETQRVIEEGEKLYPIVNSS